VLALANLKSEILNLKFFDFPPVFPLAIGVSANYHDLAASYEIP
jgi:hypothetical protein